MYNLSPIDPVDYLVIGHLSRDLTSQGPKLGGTAAYAALTAKALGLRVGIVTSIGQDVSVDSLEGIQLVAVPGEESTTFENKPSPTGRIQYIYSVASQLNITHVPDIWRNTPIVHLGPIAQEVDSTLAQYFQDNFLGLTPQGWLREWDQDGRIHKCEWPEASFIFEKASAAVLSIEDIGGNEQWIEEMASSIRILVITEGASGSRVFWNGDIRRFQPSLVSEIDPTGAGDIFATAFFIRLNYTHNPWEAARFATHLAATSVTRPGLNGVPTPQEVGDFAVEILRN
jgi:sugar/nucleoside kinase (ribokinase family)